MEILSFNFLYFILFIFGIYYIIPGKFQNGLLLTASYYFYSTWAWGYVIALVIITLFNFTYARLLHRDSRKFPLWLGVSANILLFAYLLFQVFFGRIDRFEHCQ